jgi:hypothetical protein
MEFFGMKSIYQWVLIGVMICSMVTACAAPTPSVTPTLSTDLMGTTVARTVEAMGTKIVSSLQTQQPTATQSPSLTLTPGQAAAAQAQPAPQKSATLIPGGAVVQVTKDAPITNNCYSFAFLADVTIADGTMILPGSPFKKTWAIKNTGTCTWNPQYRLEFLSGDQMGPETSFPLIKDGLIPPGEMAVVSVNMVAPLIPRKYSSFWKVKSPDGTTFGAGPEGNKALYAYIEVGPTYSFMLNMCSGVWKNNNGLMYCPSKVGSSDGYFYMEPKPQLENGRIGLPALVMVPPAVKDGKISVRFAPVIVQRDSYIKTVVSCAAGKPLCNAHAYITYSIGDGPEKVIADSYETSDGFTNEVGQKLADENLVNQLVTFTFTVETNGGPEDDVIMWQIPRIGP